MWTEERKEREYLNLRGNGVTMTSEEKKRIQEWNSELSGDIQISLLITEDRRGREFSKFCENLERLAPQIHIVKEKGQPQDIPAIRIGSTLTYHAIPLGMELEPFLEALSLSHKRFSPIPGSIQGHLEKFQIPTTLKLYISQQCPVCPGTVRQIIPLAWVNEFIQLTIIDCTLFPEIAQSNRIQSVPTVLLDEHFRWTGPLQLEELVKVIMNRDPSTLGASSLERMLEEGGALHIAAMMLDKQQIFPVFIDLLTHEKWGIRLGAMTAMEEIAEENQELAAQVIDPLWERLDDAEDTIKGDILYILGKSGDHRIAPRLEMILSGQYDAQIREAAKEALETILSEKGSTEL
ncbi:MAG: putative HAD family hydrolase [bacterium]|nr:MAG: putative HAD family hydrolase [bacterium]